MHRRTRILRWIVLLGGFAVLASYTCILGMEPEIQVKLWGGVPAALLPAYVASMVLATVGFFSFTFFLLFRADPDVVRVAGRFGYNMFSGLYVIILVPSALWLPLTSAMVHQSNDLLWLTVRSVLLVVGLGSLALLLALLCLRPRQPTLGYWSAVVGAAAFCVQTAVLDLFVWTALFPM